ncbi:MAG: AFG1 family ATPase [Alphaproteobacteria bacterium]|nr:AFG1 family ATPase [Alphaproteobacteria bacterium]
MASVLESYRQRVEESAIRADSGQEKVAARLDGLAAALAERRGGGFLARFRKREAPPKGYYIHGDVGRGKTMLMDLFFNNAEVVPKRRAHFHAFMQDVHARLHNARKNNTPDAIAPVAKVLAAEARLLCLDELQITDIADAMIVGRLFEGLLAAGTVIVTTSNLPPEDLYRDGLNRQLFLPFIRLIGARLEVISLDGSTDYRLGRVKGHETFMTPLSPVADAQLQDLWLRLTDMREGESLDVDVLGRKLHIPQAAHGCARFSFADLCERPLGPPDYLAIAHNFRTVFVEHIPPLGPERRNEAKRFVLLIDTLYDAHVRLIATSAQPPESIYPAGDHAFEFDRTVSRLREMQSAGWWGKTIVET